MKLTETLCNQIYMGEDEFLKFVRTAPRRYKKYTIKKRNGNGLRQIAQPSKEVKFLQRLAVTELRKILPISDCAMAYEKGMGIKQNAMRHKGNQYLLKMDFKDFFPSITPTLFFEIALLHGIKFSDLDTKMLSSLLFWKLRRNSSLKLSIGAPSSPFISNFVMYYFDLKINQHCIENGITYTRYADDLTFTTNKKNTLFSIPTFVKAMLGVFCSKKIKLNPSKTIYSSKAFNRHITGITITNDGNLSLGRDKKREISAMIHKYSLGLLDEPSIQKLNGILSYIFSIEPEFINRMSHKYGREVIYKLRLEPSSRAQGTTTSSRKA